MPRHPAVLTVRRQPTPTAVLLVASFGAFLAFLDSTIVNIAFPDIARDFPTSSVSSLSWVLNAYNIVFAAFLIASGRLADLLGRRRVFTSGVLVFTLSSAACALAASVPQLVAFRLVQGVGAAMLVPASLALVVEGFDSERRAHGIGLWGASAAIAAGLGPPVGGALVALSSWRLAFLVNVPLGALALVVARRQLVESRAPGRRRVPDLRGALLLAVALGALTSGVVKGGDWGWGGGRVLGLLALAAVATGLFVLSSRAHPSPVLDPTLLRIRGFAVGNLATVLAGTGFYAYLLTHVLWLSYVWHYSLLRAGLAVAPGAFVAAGVAAVLGKVADRHGHVRIVVPGALVWAMGLLWYLERVGTTPDFLGQWLPGQLISGVGVGATLPVLASGALAAVPGGAYATASAVVSSARQLGAVLGVATLVALIGQPTPLTAVHAFRHGWQLSVGCFLAVAVLAPLMGRAPVDEKGVLDPYVDSPPAPVAPEAVVAAEEPPTVLSGLAGAATARLRETAEPVRVKAGQLLFAQGEASDAAYLVRSGRLAVVDGDATVAVVGRGAVLGELGLLTGGTRSASVRAVRDSVLWRMTAEAFRAAADEQVLTSVSTALARRLQAVRQAPLRSQPGVVVAVVGAHDGAPVCATAEGLAREAGRWVRVATPGKVGAAVLARLEREHDRVLLAADPAHGQAWRDTCLRVADRAVVVSQDPAPPWGGGGLPQGCDVVLTGPAPTRAQALAWAEAVAPRSLTVPARDGGLRPLGARLAQRSLGLVLGGGGARAFAHLGVLEVLEDAGVPVDRVAGTSVGAAVAALWATGRDAAEVDAWVYEYFVRRSPLGDWTLPRTGLVRGRRTVSAIERAMDGRLFEELPRELRCVSVDLLARERFVHSRGPVSDAVAASLRLPGLYPPYPLDGRLHVDGGVLDNLPVTALQDAPEGPVVAVSISFGGGGGSGRRVGPPRVPGVADTLMRTMMMGSAPAAEAAVAAADLVIRPDAAGVGLLEFHQIDRMRESGRAAARAALPALLGLLAGRPEPEVLPRQRRRVAAAR
ncbi:MAG: MFS transporter [Nocardioidaceae bacterium]